MINNSDLPLQNIASDLDRISTALARNSLIVAEKFSQEVAKQNKLITDKSLPFYIKKILHSLPSTLTKNDIAQKADDALMYSGLLQNYVVAKNKPKKSNPKNLTTATV